MSIEIEKDIPIPEGTTKGRKQKYPFDKMEIGDSFELHNVPKNTVLNAGKSWAKRHNKEHVFTIRSKDKTVRIWRIK